MDELAAVALAAGMMPSFRPIARGFANDEQYGGKGLGMGLGGLLVLALQVLGIAALVKHLMSGRE